MELLILNAFSTQKVANLALIFWGFGRKKVIIPVTQGKNSVSLLRLATHPL